MTILLPTDFSATAQNAYGFALSLAHKLGWTLEILHVAYPEYAPMDLPVVSASDTKNKVQLARTALDAFVSLGRAKLNLEQGITHSSEVQIEVEVGNPAPTILRIARRDEVDLIVMGTKGQHSLIEKTFGSVTTEVLSKAECPVMVIPEEAAFQDFKQIAVATDLRSEEFEPLISVIELLAPLKAKFKLVHIHDPQQGVTHEESALQRLQTLFSNYGYESPAILKIGPESVVEALEDFAENYSIDMLIMLNQQRNLWERLFYRSKTRQMVFQTKIPLFIYPA